MNSWEFVDEYSFVEPPYRQPRLDVPSGENQALREVMERVDASVDINTLWDCSNVIAINRLGYSDHGMQHIEIVAKYALKMLRLLYDADIKPSCMTDHGLSYDDAEVVVFLGACLHDIGHSIHRDNHSQYSVWLAMPLLEKILGGLYAREKQVIMSSEILHCIAVHHKDCRPLTIEAGILRVSDALDMAHGRTRLWDESSSSSNIHAISTKAIESVEVCKGKTKPVCINISMSGSAGVFQVDELLRPKLSGSGIQDYVQVSVKMSCDKGLVNDFTL